MEQLYTQEPKQVTANIFNLPIGTIMPYAGDLKAAEGLIPQGWLLCDGARADNNKYPLLAKLMNKACGGTQTEFYLPDLQGVFLRGFDGDKRRDPDAALRTAQIAGGNTGNKVLTRQGDEFKEHKHGIKNKFSAPGTAWRVIQDLDRGIYVPKFEMGDGETVSTGGDPIDTGGKETRPKNVTVNYIIFAGLPQAI